MKFKRKKEKIKTQTLEPLNKKEENIKIMLKL